MDKYEHGLSISRDIRRCENATEGLELVVYLICLLHNEYLMLMKQLDDRVDFLVEDVVD